MAEAKKSPASKPFMVLVENAALSLSLYSIAGFIGRALFSEHAHAVKLVQYGFAILGMSVGLIGSISVFFEERAAARARTANARVVEALDKLKDQTPVAEISTQNVAESLKGTKVADAQLTRLVEQRKQQLLIDDGYFREELRTLIVDYLQPLPRNAKRFLNRFRVNLLIAHSRGLLTSEPKVTAQQIGKWLVLIERWPQLGRSLSAAPEKMKVLEDESAASPAKTKIVEDQPSAAPVKSGASPDAFMGTIKVLADPYFGDEDLRKFIRSAPPLALALPRLVHYGSSEPSPPTKIGSDSGLLRARG
jgi:hypothetical protein